MYSNFHLFFLTFTFITVLYLCFRCRTENKAIIWSLITVINFLFIIPLVFIFILTLNLDGILGYNIGREWIEVFRLVIILILPTFLVNLLGLTLFVPSVRNRICKQGSGLVYYILGSAVYMNCVLYFSMAFAPRV